ncbi:hypothetical protein GP486_003962 [Trichoglossum hirsutum]|uniref:Mercuric reductase n=1 Tax=Trichoglossum hirsutum TaxID=265104 RepID=A0A9P8LBP9_9PEZI|nr:hypothetical protein GP486_003962 [Trichoglossum hirsutum]
MALPRHYTSVVIGSGQAGTPLASALAKAGRTTALIERTHIGGCCVNEGCTPTKTLIASGRAAYLARRGADYGIHTPGITVDMTKIRQRKRDIVSSFRGGSEKRTLAAGVDVLMGEASFKDKKTLSVKLDQGGETIIVTADEIFINAGERPAKPRLTGIETVPAERILDSTSIQELDQLPEHLVVLGGGYVGLEFGQLFRRLGSAVTVIQRASQVLPREDPDVAECALEILRQDGITVHLNATAERIEPSPQSPIVLTVRFKDGTNQTIPGSHLLSAAGRVPNTDSLNLAAAGISTTPNPHGPAHIACNPRLETSTPGIYVLGDIKGPPAFTHISYDDFRIIRGNLIDHSSPPLTTANRLVPYVVYTDPQLGHVGLHEHEARKQFPPGAIKVAKMPMAYAARALETDETRGMMKAVVNAETSQILGFTCLGTEGGEVMSTVQTAMMGGVPWQKLRDAVWAHPAWAESLNNLWGFLE